MHKRRLKIAVRRLANWAANGKGPAVAAGIQILSIMTAENSGTIVTMVRINLRERELVSKVSFI